MDFSLLDMPYFVSHFMNNIECWTFFLWKVIIHIWEKHYQEKNLKSHSNVALLCKFGKMLSDLPMSHLVLFWKMSIIKVIEVFYCFATNEKWCQIRICLMKNVWFCFIFLVWVDFNQKPEKFRFWKSLK